MAKYNNLDWFDAWIYLNLIKTHLVLLFESLT